MLVSYNISILLRKASVKLSRYAINKLVSSRILEGRETSLLIILNYIPALF
jgi:hypothetical protein